MIYICSDIHGLYDRYKKLLDTIDLKENDRLYILGDVIDRGPDGIQILQDMMKRPNIIPFMGNHEHMMLMYLYGYDRVAWMLECNGGQVTLQAFKRLSIEEQKEITSYLNRMWAVINLRINGHRYSLSHIGICCEDQDLRADFESPDTDIWKLQKFVWGMSPYELDKIRTYPEELCPTVFVSGHIVTRRYVFGFDRDEIVVADFDNGCTYADLDCGCALGSGYGYLACVRLDEETGLIDFDDAIYIR